MYLSVSCTCVSVYTKCVYEHVWMTVYDFVWGNVCMNVYVGVQDVHCVWEHMYMYDSLCESV